MLYGFTGVMDVKQYGISGLAQKDNRNEYGGEAAGHPKNERAPPAIRSVRKPVKAEVSTAPR
jgi:hypothetical protein